MERGLRHDAGPLLQIVPVYFFCSTDIPPRARRRIVFIAFPNLRGLVMVRQVLGLTILRPARARGARAQESHVLLHVDGRPGSRESLQKSQLTYNLTYNAKSNLQSRSCESSQ